MSILFMESCGIGNIEYIRIRKQKDYVVNTFDYSGHIAGGGTGVF